MQHVCPLMPPKRDESTHEVAWKSRFPVARIKKIMQADEDVGKVAQVVPVIISKALELFMGSMIEEASRHTLETGHKRVIPGHLKMAVKGNPMFDFLEPNVEKIADPIHIQTKVADEKKVRRNRTKRPAGVDPLSHHNEEEDHISPKKVKTEEKEDKVSNRSMSIANLISQSTTDPSV